MTDFPTHARVVIVGGGIMGCSTAYHLAKLGWKDIVLLEQGRLSGGTTWHAAGLVGQLRNFQNLTRLIRYSTELYAKLEAETGLATGWRQCGSLTVARTEERMVLLRRSAAMANAQGVACEPLTPRQAGEKYPIMRTDDLVGAVWLPGLASALSSIGFGAIIAFSSLFFAERGWNPVWLAFSAFAAALIAARVFLGQLPDKLGGARVALIFVLIEAAGLFLLWLAPGVVVAAAGAALAGFGYSLVYPGLGVEAVRHAPPESRGLAMGLYTAFLDLALGFGSPLLGLIAGWAGLGSVFFASTLVVLCTAIVAAVLLFGGKRNEGVCRQCLIQET